MSFFGRHLLCAFACAILYYIFTPKLWSAPQRPLAERLAGEPGWHKVLISAQSALRACAEMPRELDEYLAALPSPLARRAELRRLALSGQSAVEVALLLHRDMQCIIGEKEHASSGYYTDEARRMTHRLVSVLLMHGAVLNKKNTEGKHLDYVTTPVHLAVAPLRDARMVRMLLRAGASIATRDASGLTPKDLAQTWSLCTFFASCSGDQLSDVLDVFAAHATWLAIDSHAAAGGFKLGDVFLCGSREYVATGVEAPSVWDIFRPANLTLKIIPVKDHASITDVELIGQPELVSADHFISGSISDCTRLVKTDSKMVKRASLLHESVGGAGPHLLTSVKTKVDRLDSDNNFLTTAAKGDSVFVRLKDFDRGVAAKILSVDRKIASKFKFTVVVDDRDDVTQRPIFEVKVVDASDVFVGINGGQALAQSDDLFYNRSDFGVPGTMDSMDDGIWLADKIALCSLVVFIATLCLPEHVQRHTYRLGKRIGPVAVSFQCGLRCTKCCCPRFVYSRVAYVILFPVRLILRPVNIVRWLLRSAWEHGSSLSTHVVDVGSSGIVLAAHLLVGSGKDLVVAVRYEFDAHCASTASVFSLSNNAPSVSASSLRIASAFYHEPPLLLGLSGLAVLWQLGHIIASDFLGALHCLLVVFMGSLLVFRGSPPSACSQAVGVDDDAAHVYPALCLAVFMPAAYLVMARNQERFSYDWGRTWLRFNEAQLFSTSQMKQFVRLFAMVFGRVLFCGAPRFGSYRARLARAASVGWITIAGVNYLASSTAKRLLEASGMSNTQLAQEIALLSRAGKNDDAPLAHLWYIGFTLTVGATLAVWTMQALASTEVTKAQEERRRLSHESSELRAEKTQWRSMRQASTQRREGELEKHMENLRRIKCLECAHCHNRPATAVNAPCGHCILCADCSASFRKRNANACPLPDCSHAQEGSPTTIKSMAPTLTNCFICYQGWESSCIFRPTGEDSRNHHEAGESKSPIPGKACDHLICVSCMVDCVRIALKDKASMFEEGGLKCPMHAAGCTAMVRLEGVRRLLSVSARVLPDPRTTPHVAPLTIAEANRFERFLEEASVPAARRLYCNNLSCVDEHGFRRLNDIGTNPPTKKKGFACIWCSTRMCPECKRPHHPNQPDCAKAKAENRSLTDAVISATTKPCPNCGFQTSHYHGHSCHHIAPGTGCPQCHTHWCYSCGMAPPQGRRMPGYCSSTPRCRLNCASTSIADHLDRSSGWPVDQRCGCAICPDCRPGRPCQHCPGSCVVCKGVVPHGLFDMTQMAAVYDPDLDLGGEGASVGAGGAAATRSSGTGTSQCRIS